MLRWFPIQLQDQFEFCKQLYREANNTEDQALKVDAYQRVIPRLMTYIERYPDHVNTQAASYYLGECYYQSGSIDEGKRILHGVVNRFREGRYVALASNRLGYDAVNEKKYSQAAVHFGRVATMATTRKSASVVDIKRLHVFVMRVMLMRPYKPSLWLRQPKKRPSITERALG